MSTELQAKAAEQDDVLAFTEPTVSLKRSDRI